MEDNYIEELKNKMAFYEYFYKKKDIFEARQDLTSIKGTTNVLQKAVELLDEAYKDSDKLMLIKSSIGAIIK